MPLCPYLRNLKGLGIRGPGCPCRTTTSPFPVRGVPAYFSRAGLGSKVSTWLTPPLMNKEMTLLARGAKWGFFGAYGLKPTGLESPLHVSQDIGRQGADPLGELCTV